MSKEETNLTQAENKEEIYLHDAALAIDKKQPFTAVVFSFLGLIEVFRDIRDVLVASNGTNEKIAADLSFIKEYGVHTS